MKVSGFAGILVENQLASLQEVRLNLGSLPQIATFMGPILRSLYQLNLLSVI